jgi:phosphoglycerate kinase
MYTLRDIELKNRRVLVRSDLNVPILNGSIVDDSRIKASLATYQYILAQGGSLAIMSHLGRPNVATNSTNNAGEFSLAPIVPVLAELLGKEVELILNFVPSFSMDPSKVYLYENTRLIAGEKSCCPQLAQNMASCCDIFVMDAFASCHRQDASTYGILEYADQFCAGFLLEMEVSALSKLINNPDRPTMAVIGGAKISGKIDIIMSLLEDIDCLVVVGAMANTFLAASGLNIGKSLYEKDKLGAANNILTAAKAQKVSFYMPQDVIVMQADESIKCKDVENVADSDIIYDIGTKSLECLEKMLVKAKTLIWNGPLGKYEDPRFALGGISFAKMVALSNIHSIAGGGDTIGVIKAAGVYDKVSYISTGGGAFLSLLENKKLPCLEKIYTIGKENAKTD